MIGGGGKIEKWIYFFFAITSPNFFFMEEALIIFFSWRRGSKILFSVFSRPPIINGRPLRQFVHFSCKSRSTVKMIFNRLIYWQWISPVPKWHHSNQELFGKILMDTPCLRHELWASHSVYRGPWNFPAVSRIDVFSVKSIQSLPSEQVEIILKMLLCTRKFYLKVFFSFCWRYCSFPFDWVHRQRFADISIVIPTSCTLDIPIFADMDIHYWILTDTDMPTLVMLSYTFLCMQTKHKTDHNTRMLGEKFTTVFDISCAACTPRRQDYMYMFWLHIIM